MPNPYHDENGRFCSKGEMQSAVDRLADSGKLNEYFKLRNELEQLSQRTYEHVPKKNRKILPTDQSDQTIIPEELRQKPPVNNLDASTSIADYMQYNGSMKTLLRTCHEYAEPITVRQANILENESSTAFWNGYSEALYIEGLGERPQDYDSNETTQRLLSRAGLQESIFIRENVQEMLDSSHRAGYQQGAEDS